ncbi:MAG TPA: 2-hydroxyacyl-CoA dehydratase [Methylomirabilota bacterium]|nr:2-hydroxyacyl-CoA dehydratase [Methylomirabilota bacterium]
MKHTKREAEVLKAAAAVFAARGFHQASVREISNEAGISLAGLYYYFPSKADLLFRIATSAFDVILEKLEETLAGVSDPEERVRVFIQNHLEFFLNHMNEMKVVTREPGFLDGEFREIVAEKQRRYYVRSIEILGGLNATHWSAEGLRASALSLFGMINWIFTWYRPEKDGDAKRMADQMADLFLYGFVQHKNGVRHGRPNSDENASVSTVQAAAVIQQNLLKEQEKISGHPSCTRPRAGEISGGTNMSTASFEELIERARQIVATPVGEVASEWKRSHPGGKVVGCFPVYSPVELIHASGALPIGVIGGGNQIEIAHADSRFQSFVCSIVKSTLELGLTEKLKDVDGMFFQSICDPARNLASVFKRNFPKMAIEYLHLPQNMGSPRVEEYLVAEYRRVLNGLQELVGRTITDQDLERSIGLYNRSRALVRSFYEVRRKSPERLSTAECYLLVRAGTLMPVEEHIALLEAARVALDGRSVKPKDRIRVVLECSFCEQPPLELIEGLEEAGCYLLDDDFLLGWRWFLGDIVADGDPVRGLARGYLDGSVYSGVKHDLRTPKAKHLVDKVREMKADAVVILAAKFCEPALFDYALYRKALDEASIPHLALEFEEKMWVFDKARSEVETFVESMLFE